MTAQAPSLHAELQKQIAGSQVRALRATLSPLYLFLDTTLSTRQGLQPQDRTLVLGSTKGGRCWHSIIASLIVTAVWCIGNVTPVLHLISSIALLTLKDLCLSAFATHSCSGCFGGTYDACSHSARICLYADGRDAYGRRRCQQQEEE